MKEKVAYQMFRLAVWLRDKSYDMAGIADEPTREGIFQDIRVIMLGHDPNCGCQQTTGRFDPKMN